MKQISHHDIVIVSKTKKTHSKNQNTDFNTIIYDP